MPPLAPRASEDEHRSMEEHQLERLAVMTPAQQWARSPFPPIADYAFLSDCEVTCLVAPNGAVEWMCLPRPDSPSVFTTMLDRSAGAFRLGPYDEMVPAARRYMP